MKTPEEIKKGLACDAPGCEGCPYADIVECGASVQEDALEYIRQLEDAIEGSAQLVQSANELIKKRMNEMESRLAHIERERDAAVSDLSESAWCGDCRHYKVDMDKEPCKTCLKNGQKALWQWRGVCEENTKEE